MSDITDMKANAERDDAGDLVCEKEITHSQGHTNTDKTNLSALLNPGRRRTGKIEILLQEARQAAEGEVENPAFPINADITNEAVPRIKDEGLEPAWKGREPARHI